MALHPQADRILRARSIVTMDPQRPRADAVAIRGDHVLAVGSLAELDGLRGAQTDLVDLGDGCVLPGLIEPHTHPDLCAECYAWVDVSGFRHPEVAQVEAALREAAAGAQPGEWLYAFGLDPMLTRGLGVWGRERLDAIAPDNPMAVMIQSMHTLFFNTATRPSACRC